MIRASACAGLLWAALTFGSGCAWQTVHVTTNVFELKNHAQTAQLDIVEEPGQPKLTESVKSHVLQTGDAASVGLYVHADGRTLAVGGPVEMDISCRTFGKDSLVIVKWGGLEYVCQGGELSDNGKEAILGAISAVAAGATGNPVGLLSAGGSKETPFVELPEAD